MYVQWYGYRGQNKTFLLCIFVPQFFNCYKIDLYLNSIYGSSYEITGIFCYSSCAYVVWKNVHGVLMEIKRKYQLSLYCAEENMNLKKIMFIATNYILFRKIKSIVWMN